MSDTFVWRFPSKGGHATQKSLLPLRLPAALVTSSMHLITSGLNSDPCAQHRLVDEGTRAKFLESARPATARR